MRASTGLNSQADRLIAYFQKRAKRGHPEARRDWLYGVAGLPNGDDMALDEVIRRAKDRGADQGFELIYVYDRDPVWTCEASKYVRNKAEEMEFKREFGAMDRWERTSPSGSLNEALAAAAAASLDTAIRMLKVPPEPPINDPVITRIDKTKIAN